MKPLTISLFSLSVALFPACSGGGDDSTDLPELAFQILKNNDAASLSKITFTEEDYIEIEKNPLTGGEPRGTEAEQIERGKKTFGFQETKSRESLVKARASAEKLGVDWSSATLEAAKMSGTGEPFDPAAPFDRKAGEIVLEIKSGEKIYYVRLGDSFPVNGRWRTADGFRFSVSPPYRNR